MPTFLFANTLVTVFSSPKSQPNQQHSMDSFPVPVYCLSIVKIDRDSRFPGKIPGFDL